MSESVDDPDSKSGASNGVRVRVPPRLLYWGIVQLAEPRVLISYVAGSSPAAPTYEDRRFDN